MVVLDGLVATGDETLLRLVWLAGILGMLDSVKVAKWHT